MSPSLDGTSIPAPPSCARCCLPTCEHTQTCVTVTAVTATSCPRFRPPEFKDHPEVRMASRAEPRRPAWHQCRAPSATWSWAWGPAGRTGMQQNLRDEQGGWPSSSRHSQFSGALSWCHR